MNGKNYIEADYANDYAQWCKTPTAQSRAAMAHKMLPVIKQSIRAAGGDPNNPVLLAKGKMMAVQSLKNYDPYKSPLNNYLYSHMLGMNRVIGTDNNIIQIPETIVMERNNLSKIEQELTDKLGRFPSTTELADKTGLSVKRIAKLRTAHVPVSEAQVDAVFGDSGMPSAHVLGNDTRYNTWMEYVYDSLDDRKKSVMERLYGLHGYKKQSATDVAKQLKVSSAAISQHRKAIDKMLDSDYRWKLFGDDV